MSPIIKVFNSSAEVAKQFGLFMSGISDLQSVALSGGSTPRLLFDELADVNKYPLTWQNIHLFWGDERCVPPDHEESNYKMTKTHLLDKIEIPDGNVHRVLGESSPSEEAERYANEIGKYVKSHEGIPQFDLIILGMGSDGHTASIFPHQMELLTSENVCEVAIHPESGQNRITLTGKVINQAKRVAFLVTGSSKTEKVQSIMKHAAVANSYPAAHIKANEVYWFLDSDAASGL